MLSRTLALTAMMALAVGILSCQQSPDIESAGISRTQMPPVPGIMLVEHWRCPVENISLLDQHSDSIWAPIFRELVNEGRFLAYGKLIPPSESEWNWMGYWMTESNEAMDTAWNEFGERLRAKHPDDPRPTAFCDTLMVRRYTIEHESRFEGKL